MLNRSVKRADAIAAFWGKSLKDKSWYSIDTSEGQAEVLIYDVIGWPFIDANTFVNDLNKIKSKEITVGLNTPGGDVFDGTAIYNALKNHPAKIITRIDGIAASMGSIIALSGDEIQIGSNAYYMIHNPWSFAIGDYREMEKEAELLQRIGSTLAQTYSSRTGIDAGEAQSMMDDETWIIGSELVEQGFADTVLDNNPAKAEFDLSMYANAPKKVSTKPKKHAPQSLKELEAGLRGLGYSRSVATEYASLINTHNQSDSGSGQSDSDIQAVNNLINSITGINHA